MAKEFLDKLADETVSGLKGCFAQSASAAEDPTTCLQRFSDFIESHKERNAQFLKEIASRIDSTFFAPLKRVDHIASPDDFIAAYHNLINNLLDIDPGTPCKADYERQQASIETVENRVRDKIAKEKQEKRRIVDDEYNRILFELKRDYGRCGTGRKLKTAWICSFILFGGFLIGGFLLELPGFFIVSGAVIGVSIGGFMGGARSADEWKGVLLGGALLGGGAGYLVSLLLRAAGFYLMLVCLGLGIALLLVYKNKIAGVQLSPEEKASYNTSIGSIEDYFSSREESEISGSTLEIVAGDPR